MSAQSDTTWPQVFRHWRDTRLRQSHAWSFLALNWAYLGGLMWWAGVFTAAVTVETGVPFRYGAPVWAGASVLCITWLLVAPKHPLLHVSAVGVPALAALSRLLDFIAHAPTRWNGVISWTAHLCVWLVILPRFLPPPLTNGERHEFYLRRWNR